MQDYDLDQVKNCYDLAAEAYAAKFASELDDKPFDRDLLARYAATLELGGPVAEFATGSGHIGAFLADAGVRQVEASDIAAKAIELARMRYPHVRFSVENMLATSYADESFAGVVCFFGLAHFTYAEVECAIKEWKRILKPGGRALFTFVAGEGESVAVEGYMGVPDANASWNFFETDKILKIMSDNGLPYEEVLVRYPYIGKEYHKKRCYVLFKK